MKIDGKLIAQKILEKLKATLSESRLHPTLAVILVGESPVSTSYIRQKQKAAEFIGAKIIVKKISNETIIKIIGELNKNSKIHSVIVQLPLPAQLDPDQIINHIAPAKDVDGFTPNSPFIPPIAMAILKVLEAVKTRRDSKFLIIGRGMTAGKPIAKTLKKLNYKVEIAHSQTTNLGQLVKSADVVISCVGKPEIVKAKDIKPGAIVIGVGIHRTTEGKLAGDFNEAKIAKVASFYTPTPGGIGPVNVACLMENLVKAAKTLNP